MQYHDEFRAAGLKLTDWIARYLEDVEGRALFPRVEPAALARLFEEPLPREGMSPDAVLREVEQKLLPYLCHVSHPGYFGFITPTPTPMGILGDYLAAALNQNIGVYALGPGAVALEARAVRWLLDLAGYGADAGGHFTSGGTMANFEALKLARDYVTGNRAQHEGVRGGEWAVYASEERHVSVDKAVDAVGFGRDALRLLPTDAEYRVRLDALEAALAEDRARGVRPACIVAMAGTTNLGAVDPLHELRRIADREHAWLHADAAYGGGLLLSERHRGALAGLELADSITIDPHKWFFAPVDAGSLLVRDARQLTRSWGMRPAYLLDEMDTAGERFDFYAHGFEQSRRFRGLKVWLSFKRYGAAQIAAWIDANIEHARYLHERVVAHPDFESAAYPVMSALCVRYRPGGRDLEEQRAALLHAHVARRIEENGNFWITTTRLKGRSWFRINPVNFRTRIEHMDGLLAELERECAAALRAAGGMAPAEGGAA